MEKKEQTYDVETEEIAVLTMRLNGLGDILERIGLDCRLMLDGDGLPFIEGRKEERSLRFRYGIVDESGESFILHLSRVAEELGEEEPVDIELDFGFLVHDPLRGETELCAQVPELGNYHDDSYYELLTELMIQELI